MDIQCEYMFLGWKCPAESTEFAMMRTSAGIIYSARCSHHSTSKHFSFDIHALCRLSKEEFIINPIMES